MPLKHSVEEVILKNGARGLLINTPDTTAVHYDIQFRAGNYYAADKSISQVAHIMEHMSFGPNERYDSLEAFSREFTENGAYHNAFTGAVDMVYSVDAAVMEWRRILDLQLLAIAKPRFYESILEAEKGNVREEIIGYANNHRRVLWQQIMRQAGLDRWFDEDELKTIDKVTLEDIERHHKATHTTNNMKFIFAGDFKAHRDTIVEMLEAIPLEAGELLPMRIDQPKSTGPVYIQRADLPSINFDLNFFLSRQLTRREVRAIRALNDIITGSFHSRIFGKARTLGICYNMGSGLTNEPMQSVAWGVGGLVSPANAEKLFKLITSELNDIAENGVTEAELQAAKDARLGGLQMSAETVGSLADWYGTEYFDNTSIDYVETFPNLIAGTTVEEIQALLKEFLASEAWSFGAIGNIGEKAFQAHYDKVAAELNKG